MSRLAWSLLIFMCKFLAILMLLQVETVSEHVEDKFQAISINKVSFFLDNFPVMTGTKN
jgi:hypothetical protein